jgi:hypothetical protein
MNILCVAVAPESIEGLENVSELYISDKVVRDGPNSCS